MQIIPAPKMIDPYNVQGMNQSSLNLLLKGIMEQKARQQEQEKLASIKPLVKKILEAQQQGESTQQALMGMLGAATEMKDPYALQNAMRIMPLFEQMFKQKAPEKRKFEAWDKRGNKQIFYRTPAQIEKLQQDLGPKGWQFSKPQKAKDQWSKPYQINNRGPYLRRNLSTGKVEKAFNAPEKVPMFKARQDGTWIQRDVNPTTGQRLEKQGWQYGQRKGTPGEDLGTFEAKQKIRAKYRESGNAPTPQQALRRISNIKKAMASLDKTNEVTSLIVAMNPELKDMVGQEMDAELKQDLMDAWQNELDYLSEFAPVGSDTTPQVNYEFTPGEGLRRIE